MRPAVASNCSASIQGNIACNSLNASCHQGKLAFRLNAGNGLTRRDQECDPRAARWLCERRRVPRNQTSSCQGRGVIFLYPTCCTRIPFSPALLLPPPPRPLPPTMHTRAQTASLPGKHPKGQPSYNTVENERSWQRRCLVTVLCFPGSDAVW